MLSGIWLEDFRLNLQLYDLGKVTEIFPMFVSAPVKVYLIITQ